MSETEPNNRLRRAQVINQRIPVEFGPVSLLVLGQIRAATDVDIYRITGEVEGNRIVLSFDEADAKGSLCAKVTEVDSGNWGVWCDSWGGPNHFTILTAPNIVVEVYQPAATRKKIDYFFGLAGTTQ